MIQLRFNDFVVLDTGEVVKINRHDQRHFQADGIVYSRDTVVHNYGSGVRSHIEVQAKKDFPELRI